jgi:hypothetical protein
MACDMIATWGSTAEERADSYPCDEIQPTPDLVLFRAVDVAAPAPILYRWLCQLRVAPYSYDWIDNFGRRSPQHLVDGLDDLEVGQRMVAIFRLAALEPGRSITLASSGPVFGDLAMTYRAEPVDETRSRLVAKIACRSPRGPFGAVMRAVLPAGDLVMMRRQLLNLRDLAERTAREATASSHA